MTPKKVKFLQSKSILCDTSFVLILNDGVQVTKQHIGVWLSIVQSFDFKHKSFLKKLKKLPPYGRLFQMQRQSPSCPTVGPFEPSQTLSKIVANGVPTNLYQLYNKHFRDTQGLQTSAETSSVWEAQSDIVQISELNVGFIIDMFAFLGQNLSNQGQQFSNKLGTIKINISFYLTNIHRWLDLLSKSVLI